MSVRFLGLPFTSATALDSSLNAGVRKYRRTLMNAFGPVRTLYLGRHGKLSLANCAYLPCVVTAEHEDRAKAQGLVDEYRLAIKDLVTSREYVQAFERACAAVGAAAASQATDFSTTGLVVSTLSQLLRDDTNFRQVSQALELSFGRVDARRREMVRLNGHIVRFDGPTALSVIATGGREELRSFDANYLRRSGLERPGDSFVLHELTWSPSATIQVFQPAVDLDASSATETARLDAKLREAETPLPTPRESRVAEPTLYREQ